MRYTTNIQFAGLRANIGTSHLAYNFALQIASANHPTLYISTNHNRLINIYEFPERLILSSNKTADINQNSFALKSLLQYQQQNIDPQSHKSLSIAAPHFAKIINYPLAHLLINQKIFTSEIISQLVMKIASQGIYDYIIVDYPYTLAGMQLINFCSLQNPEEVSQMLDIKTKFNNQISRYIFMKYHSEALFNFQRVQDTLQQRKIAIWDKKEVFFIPDVPVFFIQLEFNATPLITFKPDKSYPDYINNNYEYYLQALMKLFHAEIG